jgi:iron complex outermembrane receptor protein
MKTIYKSCYFLLLLPFSILAQNTLSGTVLDKSSGQPIPRVNVNVAQMEFRQILTESFNCQMLRKAKIVFLFIGYKKHSH